MEPLEIFAQALGIAGMLLNVISFQQKTVKRVVTFQFFGSLLFTANYFLLGAIVGSLLNFLGVFRAYVFMNKEKFHSDKLYWLIGFTALYVSTYVLSFTVFDTEPTAWNFFVEFLPIIAMFVTTVSFRMKEAKMVRRLGLINSPLWLFYNIVNFTIGGIICEVFGLVSIIIGMIRLDRKKKRGNEV